MQSTRRILRVIHGLRLAMVGIALLGTLLGTTNCAWARDLYVDNILGEDRFDGSASAPRGGPIGPTRSIQRALKYARSGDTVHIENRGVPYYEVLTLEGARHSGWPQRPFQIVSNGAVLSGARCVPPGAWIDRGNGLWQFTPDGKGYFLLLHAGQPVAEMPGLTSTGGLDPLPVGQWGALRGSIFLRLDGKTAESPADTDYDFAYSSTGITLIDVWDVRITGLIVRHFRIDGVHVHDRVERAYLNEVRLEANGRSGLAVSGTSSVGLISSQLTGNRTAGVTLRERGWLETESVTIEGGDAPPYDRSGKTTLFVDGEPMTE